jgi:transcriptional regulator with XRE-family HTH domain
MAESVAEKARWLLTNVRDPDTNEPFTLPRVIAKFRLMRPQVDVSANTIRNLFSGEVERPSWHVVEGIAAVFGVSPAVFSDDATLQELEKQLKALDLLKEARIRMLAQRAAGVSPEGIDVALLVLEHYRARQGLDSQSDTEESKNRGGMLAQVDVLGLSQRPPRRQGRSRPE